MSHQITARTPAGQQAADHMPDCVCPSSAARSVAIVDACARLDRVAQDYASATDRHAQAILAAMRVIVEDLRIEDETCVILEPHDSCTCSRARP